MQKRALIAMQYSALHNRTWITPTVQKPCTHGSQNKKAMKSFDFTASTVDIPTRWNPRAKQQPTGLIACGAMRRRPVRAPSIAQIKKEKPVHNVYWFFLVRVVIQHFLKTIVVQFVFEAIG